MQFVLVFSEHSTSDLFVVCPECDTVYRTVEEHAASIFWVQEMQEETLTM